MGIRLADGPEDGAYGRLVAYKDIHSDCNVPSTYEPDPQLGRWVNQQRSRKATLSDERIARLDELDFIWNTRAARWEEMFARLVAYNDVHGDCNVPQSYEPDPLFGFWVSLQCEFKRRSEPSLSEERIARLDKLGFDWGKQD